MMAKFSLDAKMRKLSGFDGNCVLTRRVGVRQCWEYPCVDFESPY